MKYIKNAFYKFRTSAVMLCLFGGILGGIFQSVGGMGALLPLSLILFFLGVLKAVRFKEYFLCCLLFIVPYYFCQFSFLFTLTDYMPFSFLLSLALSVLVVILVTTAECLIFLIPMPFGFFFKGKFTRALAVSLLFVLGEHIIELLPIFPFPWSRIENAFAYIPSVIEISSLFGGSFAAFIILFSSALVAAAVDSCKSSAGRLVFLLSGVMIFTVNAAFGAIRQNLAKEDGKQLSVMVVQTSIEGRNKDNVTAEEMGERAAKIILDNFTEGVKLILLPETAVCARPTNSAAFRPLIDAAKETGAVIITGCFTDKNDKSYNSLIAIEPDGSFSETFDKGLLVPFGEYAPILDEYFAMNDLSAAEEITPLETSQGKLAAAICVESVLPYSIAEQCKDDCGLLLVPTNDSWFGESSGREIHFRHCVLRAIESGRYLLRAGNCGISAIISPQGEIMLRTDENYKGEAALIGSVYYRTENTLYSELGDIIILPAALTLLLGVCRLVIKAVNAVKNRRTK